MGCSGCGKKDMSGIDKLARFKMRFIGRPNNQLVKGAPDNYIHGEVYDQPFRMSKFPFWELVEPVPVLKIPPAQADDSVFVPPDLGDDPDGDKRAMLEIRRLSEISETEPSKYALTLEEKAEVPFGQPSSEPSVSPTVPPVVVAGGGGVREEFSVGEGDPKPVDVGGVSPLLPAKKVEEPFKEERVMPEDDMPPEIAYELRTIGDGILEKDGIVEPKKKKEKS